MADQHDLERRARAVRATRDHWAGRPFDWKRTDCARVAIRHLREMGHKPGPLLSKAGPYGSALGAKRALARAGFDRLSDAVAALGMIEIAPAMTQPGDLMISEGTDGFEAVMIVVGNGVVLGFPEDGAVDLQPIRLTVGAHVRAWRL